MPCERSVSGHYCGCASSYVGSDVVEVQLAAGRSLDVDSSSQRNLLFLIAFAILESGKVLFEVANVVGDVELHKTRLEAIYNTM